MIRVLQHLQEKSAAAAPGHTSGYQSLIVCARAAGGLPIGKKESQVRRILLESQALLTTQGSILSYLSMSTWRRLPGFDLRRTHMQSIWFFWLMQGCQACILSSYKARHEFHHHNAVCRIRLGREYQLSSRNTWADRAISRLYREQHIEPTPCNINQHAQPQ